MRLARSTATAGGRLGRPLAAALLLAFALVVPLAAAGAQDDASLYQATVKVDATAANAPAARRLARLEGQRKALEKVIDRLAGGSGPRLPSLSDSTISDMVESFEVANERMSPVRYLADYTFQFYPGKVQRVMQQNGIAEAPPGSGSAAAAATAAPETTSPAPSGSAASVPVGPAPAGPEAPAAANSGRIVVLPVFSDRGDTVLWNDPNPWRDAWTRRPAETGGLSVPLGDAGDVAAIDGKSAESGDPAALAAIARRTDAGEVVVALARAWRNAGRLAGIDVSLRDYHAGRLVGSESKTYTANPDETAAAFLERAADGVAGMIEQHKGAVATAGPAQAAPAGSPPAGSAGPGAPAATSAPPTSAAESASAAISGAKQSLKAVVPIDSLADWLDVRRRLGSVAAIRQVALLSLSRRQAEVEIDYVGSADQLRSSLAGVNLALAGSNPLWRLQPAGSPRLR